MHESTDIPPGKFGHPPAPGAALPDPLAPVPAGASPVRLSRCD
ncbi:hypothetical protein ABT234_23160 [Streptomyces sp. NPDC001586]